ncbi:MAG: arginine kinase [Desulfobacter postgatei]|uniref:Arginine kinase n=1 Tax=Desulfobacter postgatei TaxID=2293 RepID=A0A2G6MTG7_9BACT|nr:MAG: arginine kinase [Desulfobacter postgatei]
MKAEPRLPFHVACRSKIKQHLTLKRYNALKGIRTSSGYSLDQAIRSGIKNPDSSIGIYAGDMESYDSFAPVLLPIIEDYHRLDPGWSHKPGLAEAVLPDLDSEKRFIRSSRIRVARNLDKFPFSGNMTLDQRLALEETVKYAFKTLPDQLSGTYTAFTDLNDKQFKALLEKGLAFRKGDRFMDAAGINRDYPLGRGIFTSRDKVVRVWVNEEDHLRIIAQAPGGDIAGIFNRLRQMIKALDHKLDFAFDRKKGFLTACPTNIGTAMRAGVHIHLEKLEENPSLLETITRAYHLQIRGTSGEKTAVKKAIFDISNARRLGISANTIVTDLHKGLQAILYAEQTSRFFSGPGFG